MVQASDFEAPVVILMSGPVLVTAAEDIGQTGLAHTSGSEDDYPRTETKNN